MKTKIVYHSTPWELPFITPPKNGKRVGFLGFPENKETPENLLPVLEGLKMACASFDGEIHISMGFLRGVGNAFWFQGVDPKGDYSFGIRTILEFFINPKERDPEYWKDIFLGLIPEEHQDAA